MALDPASGAVRWRTDRQVTGLALDGERLYGVRSDDPTIATAFTA